MTRMSTAMLSAALVTGMAGAAIAPPAVAKKKEEPAATGPKVSPAVGAAIQKAKTAFAAKDMAGTEAAVVEVEAAAKTDDEKYFASFLRYAVNSQRIADASTGTNGAFDPTPMIAPLDAMIANPSTPADMRPKFEYSRATIAYDQKNWALATQLFTAAQTHGSTEPNLPLYLAKAKVQGGNAGGGLTDLETLVAAGTPQSEDLYKYAINQANTAGRRADTIKWLQRWLVAYPTATTWRNALSFYGYSQKSVAQLDKRQQVDLFRLMRQTKSLVDQNDYEEYAQRAVDIGLPGEAKMIVDDGKATGKLPATPRANIKLLYDAASASAAGEGSLEPLERKAAAAPAGSLSAQTGDAYLSRAGYAKAVTLYRQALTKGGVNADEVNTHLGIALALSGDKAGAKTAFEAVTTTPRSEIAGFWLVWLDHPPTG